MTLNTVSALILAVAVQAASTPAAPASAPSAADRPLLTLPLAVGNRWTYTAETRTEKGTRVLLFFGNASMTRESDGVRELEIVSHDATSGHFEAVVTHTPPQGPVSTERFTVWNDAHGTWMFDEAGAPVPAFTGPPVPDPMPTEVVPCAVRLLQVEQGQCSAVGGGPLDASHGLLTGQIHQAKSSSSGVTVALGLITAGIVMPYEGPTRYIIELKDSSLANATPPSSSPFLDVLRENRHRIRSWRMRWLIMRHSPTTEELAVAVTRTRSHWLHSSLPVMLKSTPLQQRHSLLRVSMTNSSPDGALGLFLVGHPLLPTLTDEERTALLRVVDEHDLLMEQILDNQMPFLEDWLRRDQGRASFRLLLKRLNKQTPTPAEMGWVVILLGRDDERIKALRLFIPLVPDDQRASFVDQMTLAMEAFDGDMSRLEAMSMLAPLMSEAHRGEILLRMALTLDSDKSAYLEANALLRPWIPTDDQGSVFLQITESLESNWNQLDILPAGLAQLPPSQRLEVFMVVYGRLRTDSEREQAVQEHVALVSQATVEQRQQILSEVENPRNRRELAELLGL